MFRSRSYKVMWRLWNKSRRISEMSGCDGWDGWDPCIPENEGMSPVCWAHFRRKGSSWLVSDTMRLGDIYIQGLSLGWLKCQVRLVGTTSLSQWAASDECGRLGMIAVSKVLAPIKSPMSPDWIGKASWNHDGEKKSQRQLLGIWS